MMGNVFRDIQSNRVSSNDLMFGNPIAEGIFGGGQGQPGTPIDISVSEGLNFYEVLPIQELGLVLGAVEIIVRVN